MRINLNGIWVQQRNPVDAVAIIESIIVVFTEQQVRRSPCITRKHARWYNSSRVIPPEARWGLWDRQIGAKAQREPPPTVARIGKYSKIHISIRRHHRGSRSVVRDN